MTTFDQWLINNKACQPAIDWVGDKSLEEAWTTCRRGDWMEWLLWKIKTNLTLIAQARADYDAAQAQARAVYNAATAPAWAVRNAATAQAWAVYYAATVRAWAVHYAATVRARAVRNAATVQAQAVYADAIRSALPTISIEGVSNG